MIRFSASLAMCLFAGTGVLAQEAVDEFAAGRAEYEAACAACHGLDADGNGEIATMFKDPIPNLTGLAARNDGVFPMLAAIQIIDGRTGVRGHGNPMPVFGQRFTNQAAERSGEYGAEVLTRIRVLELALYLQSIQE